MYDFVFSDSSWCATFQLIWNDLKNSVVFQDIKFIDDNGYVSNLNKESFTTDDISDSFYYKIYGKKSLELKDEIVRGIKEKFNQSGDIIDKFDVSVGVGSFSFDGIYNGIYDKAFVMLLKESGKEKPYFALKVTDICKFQ